MTARYKTPAVQNWSQPTVTNPPPRKIGANRPLQSPRRAKLGQIDRYKTPAAQNWSQPTVTKPPPRKIGVNRTAPHSPEI